MFQVFLDVAAVGQLFVDVLEKFAVVDVEHEFTHDDLWVAEDLVDDCAGSLAQGKDVLKDVGPAERTLSENDKQFSHDTF